MTPLLLLMVVGQAGLLLWGAIHLSNVAMRPKKIRALLWSLVMVGGALAIAKYTATQDPQRVLCSLGDCLVLAFSVAGIRVVAVNKEEDRLALAYAEARHRAAAAAEAARQAAKAEQVRAAAALLEARAAQVESKAVDPTQPPRHLTPSILRGGTPSPRLPTSPRK